MPRTVLLCLIFLGHPLADLAAESLYVESQFRALTQDHRAWRTGDSLTVLIFENSSASANANTNTAKDGGMGLTAKSHDPKFSGRFNIGLNEDSSGGGKISRSGKLAAQITVTVQSVDPNGELRVAGKQVIKVNDEKQEIVLKGRVRPQDITETNTVVSTRLADASISYLGEGVLAEKQRPGVFSRLLSWLGLL